MVLDREDFKRKVLGISLDFLATRRVARPESRFSATRPVLTRRSGAAGTQRD